MIRLLTVAELGCLEACACEFRDRSPSIADFDFDHFREVWAILIGSGAGVVFVDDCAGAVLGAMGATVHRNPYGNEVVAEELFWFSGQASRTSGVRLYRAFMRWARENGADSIQMVHLLDLTPEKISRFYTRAGFKPVEVRYVKKLAAA